MLVFALDLQDIKKVGRGGVDLDQVFIRSRNGVREVDNLKVIDFLFMYLV